MISFITPTYNREQLVCETLDSIFKVSNFGIDIEVIVVDDASEDNTVSILTSQYKNEVKEGLLKIITLTDNIGVTGAKNCGARAATGDWVVFLDSDDLLISQNFKNMVGILNKYKFADVIFFSCLDFSGNRIGDSFQSQKLLLDNYLKHGTFGEKLPVIKRDIALEHPYYENLRGFEGLTYLEMLISNKDIYINELAIRQYRTDNLDRLSTINGRLQRANAMYKGNLETAKLLAKNKKNIPSRVLMKITTYKLLSLINRLWNPVL